VAGEGAALVTRADLEAVMPLAAKVTDSIVNALDAAMRRFEIDTPPRMAAFAAQLAHESGQLQRWTENLNYRWERLRQVFPKYFASDAEARAFDRKPERIANRVYASRMGNGPEASGDGWRYRGRGPIQLTGRDNYRACGMAIGVDLVGDPDLLATPGPGCLAAAWFWARNGLNALADAGDFVTITRRINGGLNGLAERREFWAQAKEVFGVPVAATAEVGAGRAAKAAPKPRRKARRTPKRRRRAARSKAAPVSRRPRSGGATKAPRIRRKAAARRRRPAKKRSTPTGGKRARRRKSRRVAPKRPRRRRS
jgi:putative chitinase